MLQCKRIWWGKEELKGIKNEKEDNTEKSRQQRCSPQGIDIPKEEFRVFENNMTLKDITEGRIPELKLAKHVSWNDSFYSLKNYWK